MMHINKVRFWVRALFNSYSMCVYMLSEVDVFKLTMCLEKSWSTVSFLNTRNLLWFSSDLRTISTKNEGWSMMIALFMENRVRNLCVEAAWPLFRGPCGITDLELVPSVDGERMYLICLGISQKNAFSHFPFPLL